MATWHEITRDPEYQELSEQGKALVKQGFFEREISSDPEFKAFSPQTQKAVFDDFWQTPDDTGEGALRSAASSFARGALRPLSDVPIAVGALTGLEGIERFGKNIQGGIESSFPVNPIQEGFFTTEIPGVAGQITSMLAGGGAGAVGVKALGGTAKAAQLGAKTAVGTQAFAGGTAGGAASADVLGLKGGERIARSLLGGVTELASEAIPFGMGAETGLVRNLLGESVESGAGKILTSGATEAAEEGFAETAGQATDIAFRPEQASMDLSQIGKAMLLGGAGGGLMGAINNIGRPTPQALQTPIQQALAAEINAIPTNAVPPQTEDEKRAGAEAGNPILVDPQGNTAAVAPEMWNEAIKRQITPPIEAQAATQPLDVEARLANLMRNPGLTAAVNTADSIVTTAENTSSDVSQATTAARNIIQGVVDTPQPQVAPVQLPVEPAIELPAVTPSPAMEQTENLSQTITDSNGEIAPEMSVLPPTVQTGAGAGEAIVAWKGVGKAPSGAASSDLGFFATDSKEYAKQYAADDAGLKQVSISINKPYLMGFDEFRSIDRGLSDKSAKEISSELKGAGYDGIIVTHNDGSKEYIAFSKDQIAYLPESAPKKRGRKPSLAPQAQSMLAQAAAINAGAQTVTPSTDEFVQKITGQPPITPQGTPTPATEGTVMPGGNAIERETDEQKFQRIKSMSPSQRTDEDIAFANAFSKRQKELKPQAGEATRKAFLANHTASIGGRLRKALDQTITFRGLKGTVGSWAETLYNEGWRMALDARGNIQFTNGTEALGSSGLGKVGMNYADFLSSQPQTTTVAAPTETAAPSAKEAAVASVVQQPVEGSIPTVEQESATTAIESTEKADVADAAIQEVVDENTDLNPITDEMVDSSLSPVEKREAAIILGKRTWNDSKELFKQRMADWMAGANETSKKLIKFFKSVASRARLLLAASIGLSMANSTSDANLAESNQFKAFRIPVSSVLNSKPARPKFGGLPDMNIGIPEQKIPLGAGGINLSARRKIDAKGKSIPADVVKTAQWALDTKDTEGYPFIVTDKVGAAMYFFDENGVLLKKSPVLVGKNVGDFIGNTDAGRITPSGRFEIAPETDATYGNVFSVMGTDMVDSETGDLVEVAIHRLALHDPSENRPQRIATKTPLDNRISWGCLNLDNKVMDWAVRNYPLGGVIYILPETAKGRSAFAPFSESNIESSKLLTKSSNVDRLNELNNKEDKKLQAAQKQREELGLKTLNSLIEKTRTNVVQGSVKSSDANQAVAILNKSGAIPNVLFTWIGTSKDFLADPANRARYPETWKAVSSNPNIEGMSENGQPIVFTDNVGVSDLDRNLAKLQGTTPEVAAVRRVILHENIHKGMFFLSLKDKMKLFQFLHRLYSPEELDQLAKSYDEYSDWRINQVSYFSIIEEAMTRDFDSMAEIPRDGIWAEFMQFLRDIWQKITGKTSEPTLKNYKDVFRLIRNSLKNSEAANADRLKNGGDVRMSIASKVEYDSPNEAAFNSGAEVARNSYYDERDKAVRSTIREAYDLAPKDNGPSVPLDQLFDIAKQSMPDLTEGEFSQILQDLYEDSGALLQAGESPFIVTTPDGQRAGSVIVMPPSGFQTRAMASIVDSPATNEFTQSVDDINNGTAKAAFSGRQFKDFKPIDRTVKSAEEYSDVAIKYVNNLEKEGVSLDDIANSVISPVFLESIGIEQDLMAQDALTIEVRQRVDNAARKEKSPGRKKQLSKLSERLSAFWQGVGSKKGQHLGQRRYLVNKARYSWMFIRELAEKAMKEARTNILISNFGSENATSFTQNSYADSDKANQQAVDDNINAVEESQEFDQDAADLAAGEATLTGAFLKLYEELKDLIRQNGLIAKARDSRVANAAKASISDTERNAIMSMSDAELNALESKNNKRIGEILNTLLGKEADANTPEKKTVRKKREKMVEVSKKRADKGQTIDPAETANDIAIRLLNEFENKLAKSAFFNSATKPDTIVKAFREQISDPMDRKAFKDRLMAMEVTSEMADRLFDKAARTKDNAQWKRAQDMLEGPNALRNIIREINKARPGDQAPLSKQIPWRELLSQNAKTVEEYRQRIFDAISANEELKSATPDQKARLADLFAEAWESNRTRILDGMLERMIRAEEAKKNLSKEGAKALQEQRMRIVEDINLGIFDNDELAKRMAEKFGVKSEFTEMEREKINSLIEVLQDEGLNAVKRQVAAYKLLEVLQGELKIPVAKMLADFWVSSVLSGPNTIVSIGLAVASGAFELSTALSRVFIAGFTNQKQLPSELAGAYKTLARLLSAFGRQANIAWQYLVTGDPAFLDPSMNDVTENMQWGNIGKSNKLAEQMAKSDKILVKSAGLFMRTVSRLLTALDVFNSGLTKEGSLSIVFRQIGLDPEKIAALEKKSDLKPYKDAIIQKDFGGTPPKSARDKAIVDSYALSDMMAELDKLGNVSENANFFGQQGAMTLDPSGLGGVGYRAIRSLVTNFESGSDRFLKKAQRGWSDSAQNGDQILSGLELAFAYALQFLAYNAANFGGVRFARFAGNKFNQGLSFIPGIGFARAFEAEFDPDRIKAKEAFIDSIQRNQLVGVILSIGGYYILKAIADEPDDEKRGWFINGGWGNLTPEKKQQKLAAGEKEYTIGINGKVFNYANWPISSALAAIGSLSDLIRFSPDQWKDKNVTQIMASAAMSGAAAAADIPALSQFQELFGNSLSSKDPNEKRMERFAKVMSSYAGGFVPRFLKDIDYAQDPNLRKYETLWEKTASHIPVYRRYEGKEYYDILGQQIQRNIYPGSREFMTKPTDPAYKVLGALNSRGIWLTPANAEHRMVGKGARRRSLTQEEADNYSLETGKGYKQMLLRYGQRALQMPTERAKAFLLDKADDVRDRALKKVYRGYTPAS